MQVRFLNIKTTVTVTVHETSVSLYIRIIKKNYKCPNREYMYI